MKDEVKQVPFIRQPYQLANRETVSSTGQTEEIKVYIDSQIQAGLIPFIKDNGQIKTARAMDLNEIGDMFMGFESKRFSVAKRVVRSLLKSLKYSELNDDFNLGDITKEEFKIEAKKFAVDPRHPPAEELRFEAITVLDLTGYESIDSHELSMMLQTDPIETELIIRSREQSLARA